MRNLIDRPLIDDERSLLLALATRVVADQTGCTHDEAADVLAKIVEDRGLVITGDALDVCVEASGTLLVHAERDWLAFHSRFPGHDPMKNEIRADRVDQRKE